MSYNIRECASAFPEFASACYQSLTECGSALSEVGATVSKEEILECGKSLFWGTVNWIDQSTERTVGVISVPIFLGFSALKAKRPYLAASCFAMGIAAAGMKAFYIYDRMMNPINDPNPITEEKENFSQPPYSAVLQLKSGIRELPTYYSSQPLVPCSQASGQCPSLELK